MVSQIEVFGFLIVGDAQLHPGSVFFWNQVLGFRNLHAVLGGILPVGRVALNVML